MPHIEERKRLVHQRDAETSSLGQGVSEHQASPNRP